METPVNKQAALFLSRKRRADTVQDAIDGAVNHLMSGKINEQLAAVFGSDQFGPEPQVTFRVSIRRDPKTPGQFAYTAKTSIQHDLGSGVQLFGLKP
jgi:hypothetical protein